MLAKIGEQLAVSIELLLKPDTVLGVEGCLLLLDHLPRVCHGPSVPLATAAVVGTRAELPVVLGAPDRVPDQDTRTMLFSGRVRRRRRRKVRQLCASRARAEEASSRQSETYLPGDEEHDRGNP